MRLLCPWYSFVLYKIFVFILSCGEKIFWKNYFVEQNGICWTKVVESGLMNEGVQKKVLATALRGA